MVDLTTAGATGTINGAWFYEAHAAATGSGSIMSFVRIDNNGNAPEIEQGYNTDGRPLQYNEMSSATFTHSLLLSNVPVVTLNGTLYREFLLDINQRNNNPLLSLDAIQIYRASTKDLIGPVAGLGTPVYNLDAGKDNWIKMDYSLNAGSGSGDMFAYIPNSLFGLGAGDYVYLYSMFGTEFPNNAGFEEWAVRKDGDTPTAAAADRSASGLLFSACSG